VADGDWRVGVITGEREEDLIESWPAYADLFDRYRSVIEAADHRRKLTRSTRGRNTGMPPRSIEPGYVRRDAFEDSADGIEPRRVGETDLDDIAPHACLEIAERA